jgi:hypothetical protein
MMGTHHTRTPATPVLAGSARRAAPPADEHESVELPARGAMVFTGVDRDRYWATLRDLDVAGLRLHTALFEAQIVVGPTARHAALVGLHNQLREMAGLLNHALGGWPEPTGGDPR